MDAPFRVRLFERYCLSAGLLNCMALSYALNSETEHIISLTSVVGGNNFMGNLSRAFQGFVYIFGSLIVNVIPTCHD